MKNALIAVIVVELMACQPDTVTFTRVGDQPHVLVLSGPCSGRQDSNAESQQIRRGLEQLAVDRRWFLYETNNLSVVTKARLDYFAFVVLHCIPRSVLSANQRRVLDDYEAGIGRTVEVTDAGQLATAF